MDLQTFPGVTQGNPSPLLSPASSHSPFPAHTSLIPPPESQEAAPSMQPNALQRSLVMLLMGSPSRASYKVPLQGAGVGWVGPFHGQNSWAAGLKGGHGWEPLSARGFWCDMRMGRGDFNLNQGTIVNPGSG